VIARTRKIEKLGCRWFLAAAAAAAVVVVVVGHEEEQLSQAPKRGFFWV